MTILRNIQTPLVSFSSCNDSEYEEEKVDDIKIEVERSEDVFLRRQSVLFPATHHDLCIVHKILKANATTDLLQMFNFAPTVKGICSPRND